MHESWQKQLPFYVAGTLSPAERAALERHLAGCALCREAVGEWQAIAQAVRRDAAGRVDRLPPLRVDLSGAAQFPTASPNGRRAPLTTETTEVELMSTRLYLPELTGRARAPRAGHSDSSRTLPFAMLAAAVITLVLLGGALWALGARQNHHTGAGPQQQPGALLAGSATPTPALLPAETTPDPLLVPPTAVPSASPLPPVTPDLPADLMPPTVPATPSADFDSNPAPDAESARLEGVRYEAQEWNNAGAAALAMALSVYGWEGDQQAIARWIRPNSEDKSVTPEQMAAYVNAQTPYRAQWRMGGTPETLERLLAAGFPVIVQVALETPNDGWFGHYLLLAGYDRARREFYAYDSYLGGDGTQGRTLTYRDLNAAWKPFNHAFIAVYESAREGDALQALGPALDPVLGLNGALESARQDAQRDPTDVWAWFDMGTSYTALGQYDLAALAYDRAFALELPFRTLWYQFGPLEAYFYAGRYDDVLRLAEATLGTTEDVEELYYWEAWVSIAAGGDLETALDRLNQALSVNPNYAPALETKRTLLEGPADQVRPPAATALPSTITATPIGVPAQPLAPEQSMGGVTPTFTATPFGGDSATPTFTPTAAGGD